MQAIILAAGMGKRLKQLTKDNTKCMVKVNGVPLIDRTLAQLEPFHLSRIVIVTGYKARNLTEHIKTLNIRTPIVYVENPIYDRTNNIYSLYLARDYLMMEDTLLLESDIIFEDSVLRCLAEDPGDSLALVAKYESWMDGTCVRLSEQDDIEAIIPGSQFRFSDADFYYKTVNLYKFSREFSRKYYVPFLEAYLRALGNNEYYEQVLKVLVALDNPGIKAKRLDEDQRWYEIDDIQDLDIAESMFAPEDQKVPLLSRRYGGYWRYPRLVDFCYLVNSYYPPGKLLDEIKANFDTLARQYPSGMYVNSLLAARNYSLRPDQVLVGNGAAELIKTVLENLTGQLGVIRPAFEEYCSRYPNKDLTVYRPDSPDFSYHADDVIRYFRDHPIRHLVLVNPDNPTGNYLRRREMERLIEWTKEQNITLIADESFIDFADEDDPSLLHEALLDQSPHLIVIKSISKSCGIPGLRLGIAASGNSELIRRLKKDVSIWNINSFGEFYMQIEEKYRGDYLRSLSLLREERERFAGILSRIKGLSVLPSQANFLMAEVTAPVTATRLTEILLNRYNLFIKDLSSKIPPDRGQFVRIAVRNRADDDRLARAIGEILTTGIT